MIAWLRIQTNYNLSVCWLKPISIIPFFMFRLWTPIVWTPIYENHPPDGEIYRYKEKALAEASAFLVTRRGFEPRTHCLKGSCSADWARGSYIIINKTGWDGRIRTDECQSQSLMPYRLATSQYRCDSLWPDTLSIIAWNLLFGNPFFHFFQGFRLCRKDAYHSA